MSATVTPPAELRERGFRALVKELGYADALRFLYQFETARADYTAERPTFLPAWSAQEIAEEAERLLQARVWPAGAARITGP